MTTPVFGGPAVQLREVLTAHPRSAVDHPRPSGREDTSVHTRYIGLMVAVPKTRFCLEVLPMPGLKELVGSSDS